MSAAAAPTASASPPRTRVVLDVSDLPDVAFGYRDIVWWGTLGFIVIEGFTLALAAVVYLYLWKNFPSWPPAGTDRPTLLVPTIHVGVMLLSIPVMVWMKRAAERFDLVRVRAGMWVGVLLAAGFVALRAYELLVALNVRWDTNAYGSAQWLMLGVHGTLLLVELVEVAGFAVLFTFGTAEEKHFSDASDAAFYWYFMVLSWIPIYVLSFWGPRLT